MRNIVPMALTLNSSTVADTSAAAYNAATTYALDATVSATDASGNSTLKHEYKSLQAGNTGNALIDPAWWHDMGPTNQLAMFDDRATTITTATTTLTVNVAPGDYFDTISLQRLKNVSSVQIKITRAAETLYNETITLEAPVYDWAEYFFGPLYDYRDSYTWTEEVWYSDCVAQITLTGPPGETIECGLLLIGRADDFGLTLYGVEVSIEDYSTKETDETFGTTYLLEREYASRASCQIILDRAQTAYVKRKLAAVRATPALYDLNNEGESDPALILFGKYDDFSINYTDHAKSYCALTLLELI